ncbi:nuclear transport factor 2 family protein [Paraburkholderia nemoris]|uniref:nuclear transport factor 2 family protein n=1 Tax=Paraburkholderia nemoris TaxID=2793076 RepID=UPI0038B8F0C3
MNDRIEKLLDLEEIRGLRIKYGHFLDSNSIDELGLIFAPDAICDVGQGPWVGRQAILTGLEQAFIAYDLEKHGSYPFLHAVTNHWVEFIDKDTAQGRCYLLDLQTIAKPERDPWILLGMYADEYRRIDGQWYISRSRLDVAWPERNVGGGHPGKNMVLPVQP